MTADLEAVARRIWDQAAEHTDAPATTVGCPHALRFCDDCEQRIDNHAATQPIPGAEQ